MIGVSPLFFVIFIEALVYQIVWSTNLTIDTLNHLGTSYIIIDGLGRTSIAWVVISMSAPGFQWNNVPNGTAMTIPSGHPSQTTPPTANQQQYPWQINVQQQPNSQQGGQIQSGIFQSWNGQSNGQQQQQPMTQYQYAPPQHPPPGRF
jgi:hypothetical protein